jgi:glycosyltransferase involved in cell wall biosynthesis
MIAILLVRVSTAAALWLVAGCRSHVKATAVLTLKPRRCYKPSRAYKFCCGRRQGFAKMRIGIWCDYGFTLEPSEGIGVFVDNLARGLVRADPSCQVVLKAHQGQERVLDSTVAGGLNRISVIAGPRMSRLRRRVVRNCKKIRRALNQPTRKRPLAFHIDQLGKRIVEHLIAPSTAELNAHIDSCDVWLLPYVGCEQDFSRPTVVAIHDLVCYHFPDMMQPAKLAALKRLIDRVSNRATLAACMSEFICKHDLIGTLDLPINRVRVIKAAVPDDFGMGQAQPMPGDAAPVINAPHASLKGLLPFPAETPFLFYPAAFRTYKNHRCLVDALHLIKQRSNVAWKLVFTGIHRCPKPLEAQIARLGLKNDVVVLKKVSRAALEQLYRSAFATVVPSLYEQGSFPIMEALHCHCPVAASDIPALREQFADMRGSMFFFDPHSPATLVPVIESIWNDRASVIESQARGFSSLRQNTWEKSAQEWLLIFREAIELSSSIEQQRLQRAAA